MNLIQNDEESNSDLAKWPWSGKYHAGCPTVVTYIGLSPYPPKFVSACFRPR